MNINYLIQKTRYAVSINVEKRHAPLTFLSVGVLVILALMPEIAMAAPWDGAATKVLEIFTSGLVRTLAIIAVIACGLAAFGGKLSWDWAIKIIVGIVLTFGATSIVDYVIAGVA
jgi:type IV secretory pathway VirB2 component (pilin)